MSFANAITRLPLPFEPDRAAETLKGLDWAGGPLRDLRAGALDALYSIAPVRRTLMRAGIGVR